MSLTAAWAFLTSPLGKGVAIVLAIVIALGVAYGKGRGDGKASCEAAVAQAIVEQERKDKELSARLLSDQRESLTALHNQTLASLKAVQNAPVTSSCGPVVRDAASGVRSRYGSGAKNP